MEEEIKVNSKSIEDDCNNIPLIIKIILNLFITFALSLSIYLLLANVILTVHKMSLHSNMLRSSHHDEFSSFEQQRPELFQSNKDYYDCSQGILSMEECDLINRYHSDYLHSVRSALMSKSKFKNYVTVNTNSLKVNTSFFIR
jgi:hypothetical protein